MAPKKAVIYVRVSTTDQAEKGVSLDNQEAACNDWLFRNGIPLLKLFREEGVSAKTLQRPKMLEMLELIKERHDEIGYVVIYQVDRLSRNMADFVDFTRLLYSYGIELRDSTSQLEASESDELILNIQAVLAQHDNRLKARRVSDNMKRHASDGYRMHKAPLGLRNVRDAFKHSTVEPVQPTADKVAHILTEFAKGVFTKGQLLHEARRIDLRQANGKPMSYQYLDKLLRQPLYAGLERSTLTGGELISSTFTGIVPEWVFHTNQQLLESRQDNYTDGYKSLNPDYPMRKFVTCAECGSLLRGSAPTGRNGKRYPRYHCTNPDCHSAHVDPDTMHEQFKSLLADLSPDTERLRVIQTVIVRVWKEELGSMRLRRDKLRQQSDKLSEQKVAAAEKVVTGDITGEEKTIITKRLQAQIGTIQSEVAKLDSKIGTKEEAVEYAVNYIGNAARLWDKASPELKQVYQRMVFPEGMPYDLRKKEFGTAKMSQLYTLAAIKKDPSEADESLLVTPRGVEPLIFRMRT